MWKVLWIVGWCSVSWGVGILSVARRGDGKWGGWAWEAALPLNHLLPTDPESKPVHSLAKQLMTLPLLITSHPLFPPHKLNLQPRHPCTIPNTHPRSNPLFIKSSTSKQFSQAYKTDERIIKNIIKRRRMGRKNQLPTDYHILPKQHHHKTSKQEQPRSSHPLLKKTNVI